MTGSRGGWIDRGLSALASAVRLGSGARVIGPGARPTERLVLYEFEACPFCRKVREALSTLDLDALVLPCPKRGRRFRPALVARGGRAQFPYLVDPGRGVEMYESDDIVRYLFAQYGSGPVSWQLAAGGLTDAGAMLAGLPRHGRGGFAHPSAAPERPLVLFGYEASPGCRRVREVLCEREIAYHLENRGPGSQRPLPDGVRRAQDLPVLVDPNHGVTRVGADAALDHLAAAWPAL